MKNENAAGFGKALESACKAYAYRTQQQKTVAALNEIERYPVGSDEWKAAVKKNAETLSE